LSKEKEKFSFGHVAEKRLDGWHEFKNNYPERKKNFHSGLVLKNDLNLAVQRERKIFTLTLY
jgi:hypothetical protein